MTSTRKARKNRKKKQHAEEWGQTFPKRTGNLFQLGSCPPMRPNMSFCLAGSSFPQHEKPLLGMRDGTFRRADLPKGFRRHEKRRSRHAPPCTAKIMIFPRFSKKATKRLYVFQCPPVQSVPFSAFFPLPFFLIPNRSRHPLKSFFRMKPRPCVVRLLRVK